MNDARMTFWDHLEVLRKVIFRILAVALVAAIAAFCFKDLLFRIILAPGKPDFALYRLLGRVASAFGADASQFAGEEIKMFSATLTTQFMTHLKIAFWFGMMIALPYIIYQLYGFVAPALRQSERKYTVAVIVWSYVLFMAGVLLNYFLIFPLAFRFLGTYQVSADVPNIITLNSYTDMLLTLTVMMGVLFELPIMSWFLAKLGFINAAFMKKYRKHAFVAILVIGAIITPTTDIFTLMVVSVPIYLLYEASIAIVKKTQADAPTAEEVSANADPSEES